MGSESKRNRRGFKTALGVLFILAGIALGVYVGFFLMFVGGIIQVVNAVNADPANSSGVAWGAARILFAGAIGGFAFWLLALPGVKFVADDSDGN